MITPVTDNQRAATRAELLEVEHIQLQILISQDMLDRDVRRLRWWVLTQAILLLALTIVVVHR
jgi:hypothetical protein